MQQGLAAAQLTGTELGRVNFLAPLAAAYGRVGRGEEGLSVVSEALDLVRRTQACSTEAGLYWLKGELTLQSKTSPRQVSGKSQTSPKSKVQSRKQFSVISSQLSVPNAQSPTSKAQSEAEMCFLKAIEVAQRQQAKSLELRASTSLARLWQQQGKRKEAHEVLANIYGWFTEGFGTKDLQEAKALLEELSQ